jgi:hypothetical protein
MRSVMTWLKRLLQRLEVQPCLLSAVLQRFASCGPQFSGGTSDISLAGASKARLQVSAGRVV